MRLWEIYVLIDNLASSNKQKLFKYPLVCVAIVELHEGQDVLMSARLEGTLSSLVFRSTLELRRVLEWLWAKVYRHCYNSVFSFRPFGL